MSFFCIHGSGLLLLIILLFIKQRKQVIAVKCLFCKIHKRKCFQMKILKLLSFGKFHCPSYGIFFKPLTSKLNFYRRNRHQSGQKSHSTLIFCNFLNRVPKYPIYNNFLMSPIHCEDFRKVTQIEYLWCG